MKINTLYQLPDESGYLYITGQSGHYHAYVYDEYKFFLRSDEVYVDSDDYEEIILIITEALSLNTPLYGLYEVMDDVSMFTLYQEGFQGGN